MDQQNKIMRIEVLKPTQDDWHGSYIIDGYHKGVKNPMLVEVTFHGNIMSYDPELTPIWRTSVWGNDDCGMEYDCASEAEAWNMFLQVISMKHVNRKDLNELGFVRA